MLLENKKDRTNLRSGDVIVINSVNQTLKVLRFTDNSVLGSYHGKLLFETLSLTKEGSLMNGENEALEGDSAGISVRDFLEIILCVTNLMVKPIDDLTEIPYKPELNDKLWVLVQHPEDEFHG